jgi:hypothetical protein
MKTRAVLAFNNNRVFCTDALLIRTENAVGARSAQIPSSHATAFKTLIQSASNSL